jgi:hypothetical protein
LSRSGRKALLLIHAFNDYLVAIMVGLNGVDDKRVRSARSSGSAAADRDAVTANGALVDQEAQDIGNGSRGRYPVLTGEHGHGRHGAGCRGSVLGRLARRRGFFLAGLRLGLFLLGGKARGFLRGFLALSLGPFETVIGFLGHGFSSYRAGVAMRGRGMRAVRDRQTGGPVAGRRVSLCAGAMRTLSNTPSAKRASPYSLRTWSKRKLGNYF